MDGQIGYFKEFLINEGYFNCYQYENKYKFKIIRNIVKVIKEKYILKKYSKKFWKSNVVYVQF